MATSPVEIANLALGHLGAKSIASLTERSLEAQVVSQFYEQTRDEVLREFDWSFARRSVALALVAEDPTAEWQYSYRYPSDAVAIRRLTNGYSRIETNALQTKTLVVGDAVGRLIYVDQADSVMVYTSKVTDVTMYPADFAQALALKLAFYIAPRITGGDEFKLGARAAQLYEYTLAKAMVADLNESVPDLPADSEFITIRES